MASSRRKSTATRAKFKTELVTGDYGIRAVPCGAADSALFCADKACTALDAPVRQKDTCVAKRQIANAPRAPVVPARLESTPASASAFLSVSNKSDDASLRIAQAMFTPLIDAHDFQKTHFTLRLIRAQVFYGGTKWFY